MMPDWLVTVVSFVASSAIIFGGVVPYIPQYREIVKSRSSDGFSTFICFILLVANILRILFWIARPFELPLLAQSILMIIAQLVMLHLCIGMKQPLVLNKRQRFRDLDAASFWNWGHFSDYIEFLALFTVTMATLTFLMLNVPVFCELLGFLSTFTEACLGLPQWLKNNQSKSTAGMSVAMVACWLSGDVFKTIYFFVRDAPLQFGICGILQIGTDLAILYQVYAYSHKAYL